MACSPCVNGLREWLAHACAARAHDREGLISVKREANEERKALLSPAKRSRAAAHGDVETMAFDRVWGPASTQESVFEQVQPLVDCAFEGYNSTIFAYGPSGSGKTHTMIGTAASPGVVPRSVERVLQLAKAQPQQMFVFVLSVLELYNDQFYDLLEQSPSASASKRRTGPSGIGVAKKIEVVRNGKSSQLRGDYVKLQVDSAEGAMAAIEAGLARRSTSGTQLNDRSSRSHAVVILQAQQASVERRASSGSVYHTGVRPSGVSDAMSGLTTIGTLYMVDLAGSERVKVSGVAGDELEEAKHINKSLSALGNVLTTLSSKNKGAVVPYRDSKLTLLLQVALVLLHLLFCKCPCSCGCFRPLLSRCFRPLLLRRLQPLTAAPAAASLLPCFCECFQPLLVCLAIFLVPCALALVCDSRPIMSAAWSFYPSLT